MDLNGKNGQSQQVFVENLGGLAQLSADGQQWEIRIHVIAHFPEGNQVVGECVMRSFRQGIGPLQHMANEVPKLARAMIVKATSGLDIPVR